MTIQQQCQIVDIAGDEQRRLETNGLGNHQRIDSGIGAGGAQQRASEPCRLLDKGWTWLEVRERHVDGGIFWAGSPNRFGKHHHWHHDPVATRVGFGDKGAKCGIATR